MAIKCAKIDSFELTQWQSIVRESVETMESHRKDSSWHNRMKLAGVEGRLSALVGFMERIETTMVEESYWS